MAPTTEEWRKDLTAKLVIQQNLVGEYEKWYDGDHPLPYATASDNDLYKSFQGMSKTNGIVQVVDAPADRLVIEGIRMGKNKAADEQAWDLWQNSHMDAMQPMVFTTALTAGLAYISVWPDEQGVPMYAPEHPGEVCHQLKPGSLRDIAAAIKITKDEVGNIWYATVYEPGKITTFKAQGEWNGWGIWEQVDRFADGRQATFDNPYGQVPLFPLLNRPNLRGQCSPEFLQVIPIQRRINQTILNMLVAAESVAFPQRWATGLSIEKDANGQPKRPFKSGADAMAVSEKENAKFGQFAESEFAGYLNAIAADFEHMCSISSTPLFAMSSNLSVPPSAEALVAMESGLVKKVLKKQRVFGEAFEDVTRFAFKILNDERQNEINAEVIWGDPTVTSQASIADWAVKAQAAGVPQEVIWERMHFTPPEIQRMKAMQMADALRQIMLQVAQQKAGVVEDPNAPKNDPKQQQPKSDTASK